MTEKTLKIKFKNIIRIFLLLLIYVTIGNILNAEGEKGRQLVSNKSSYSWPPRLNQPYPDLELYDHNGNLVKLSSFKGRVLLIEPIGMSCSACNAFVGGNKPIIGGYKNIRPQSNLKSIEEYLPEYSGGIGIDDPRIVFIQLLLFNLELNPPTITEAKEWADHFAIDFYPNHIVLVGNENLKNRSSRKMIPGFQLVDQNFILRADSTGHKPTHSLHKYLLPLLGQLVRGNSDY